MLTERGQFRVLFRTPGGGIIRRKIGRRFPKMKPCCLFNFQFLTFSCFAPYWPITNNQSYILCPEFREKGCTYIVGDKNDTHHISSPQGSRHCHQPPYNGPWCSVGTNPHWALWGLGGEVAGWRGRKHVPQESVSATMKPITPSPILKSYWYGNNLITWDYGVTFGHTWTEWGKMCGKYRNLCPENWLPWNCLFPLLIENTPRTDQIYPTQHRWADLLFCHHSNCDTRVHSIYMYIFIIAIRNILMPIVEAGWKKCAKKGDTRPKRWESDFCPQIIGWYQWPIMNTKRGMVIKSISKHGLSWLCGE